MSTTPTADSRNDLTTGGLCVINTTSGVDINGEEQLNTHSTSLDSAAAASPLCNLSSPKEARDGAKKSSTWDREEQISLGSKRGRRFQDTSRKRAKLTTNQDNPNIFDGDDASDNEPRSRLVGLHEDPIQTKESSAVLAVGMFPKQDVTQKRRLQGKSRDELIAIILKQDQLVASLERDLKNAKQILKNRESEALASVQPYSDTEENTDIEESGDSDKENIITTPKRLRNVLDTPTGTSRVVLILEKIHKSVSDHILDALSNLTTLIQASFDQPARCAV